MEQSLQELGDIANHCTALGPEGGPGVGVNDLS